MELTEMELIDLEMEEIVRHDVDMNSGPIHQMGEVESSVTGHYVNIGAADDLIFITPGEIEGEEFEGVMIDTHDAEELMAVLQEAIVRSKKRLRED